MAEYINRKTLLTEIENLPYDISEEDSCFTYYLPRQGFSKEIIKLFLKELPAADVAPVVRCEDCKYHDLGQEPRRCESLGYCILMGAMTPDEGFCYLAKRRR